MNCDELQSYYSDMYKTTEELTALQFFWKNSRSIEILKEGNLQRIRFRVKDYVCDFLFFIEEKVDGDWSVPLNKNIEE